MAQSESETVLTEHHETDNLDPRTDAPARPGTPVHIAPVQLGNITVPLMLVVIGVALVGCFRGMLENWYDMLLLSVVRLVLIPVALLLLLRLLPLPEEAYQVAAVVALMPAASSSVLIAKRYGGDPDFAGRAIILTTLFSLGTIPLLMALFLPA